MKIQNNASTNFQAKHLLNVRKTLPCGKEEVIDVFRLDKSDRNFSMQCYQALKQNYPSDLNSSTINSLKAFFSEFLSVYLKKELLENFSHLIAIKNEEVISGFAETNNQCSPRILLNKFVTTDKSDLAKKSLMYGLVSNAKDITKKYIPISYIRPLDFQPELIGGGKLFENKNLNPEKISVFDYGKVLANIRIKMPDTKFTKTKTKVNIDLQDFLGIKDFETDIIS